MHLIKFAACHHAFAPTKYENGDDEGTMTVAVLNAFRRSVLKHKHLRAIKSKSVRRGYENFLPFLLIKLSFLPRCVLCELVYRFQVSFSHLNLFFARKPLCSCAGFSRPAKTTWKRDRTILNCITLWQKVIF